MRDFVFILALISTLSLASITSAAPVGVYSAPRSSSSSAPTVVTAPSESKLQALLRVAKEIEKDLRSEKRAVTAYAGGQDGTVLVILCPCFTKGNISDVKNGRSLDKARGAGFKKMQFGNSAGLVRTYNLDRAAWE